jgi:Nucleotidyl transferase AbiEii toxin, Type IV TA system
MDPGRLNDWEPLFHNALRILDDAADRAGPFVWSFGGGTALMRAYRHRYSRDIDIFVRDPQLIGYLTPRLSPAAEELTDQYEEGGQYVKLRFDEGEIDFIGTGWLLASPYREDDVLGRRVNVERPAEIIAKKVRYRADTFKARDIFDIACVWKNDPGEIHAIKPILREYRKALDTRIEKNYDALREEFEALDLFDRTRDFDQCLGALRKALGR